MKRLRGIKGEARRASTGRPNGTAIWRLERHVRRMDVLGGYKAAADNVGSPHHGPSMRGFSPSERND
ncbi:hypothetical protein, partial [Roseovarius indicus]|uniref:hypothetical protein n=1 Tax=Roseovarius indicus TaxID=540747 RepID=UPI0040584817